MTVEKTMYVQNIRDTPSLTKYFTRGAVAQYQLKSLIFSTFSNKISFMVYIRCTYSIKSQTRHSHPTAYISLENPILRYSKCGLRFVRSPNFR